jgi:hypothetical protein
MILRICLANVHWLPVIVTTVLSFALGAFWHTPFMFGKTWTRENYPKEAAKKMNVPLMFAGTAAAHLLALTGLGATVGGQGAGVGLGVGLLVALALVLPALAGTYLFASRSLRLLAIDAGMYVALFAMAGPILAAW